MARTGLEEQLESITQDFVRQIVSVIRNASFADVAKLEVASSSRSSPTSQAHSRARPGQPANRVSATPVHGAAPARSERGESKRGAVRQTADRRAELGERVVKVLGSAAQPLGVRALSSELGVEADLLATPLLELRAAGRIAKHGEKRATTYSLP
jgi:hypothetical protein